MQLRSETKVLFIILDGEIIVNKKEPTCSFPASVRSKSSRRLAELQPFSPPSGTKVCVPRSFKTWVSCSFSLSDSTDIRQSVLLHTFPWPHWQQHSLSLLLSLSLTLIHTYAYWICSWTDYCLISHPHNPTTLKINQAPKKTKKKRNGIRGAWRQEIFKKATVNIQKHIIPTGIWHEAQCWGALDAWKLWMGWRSKSCQ